MNHHTLVLNRPAAFHTAAGRSPQSPRGAAAARYGRETVRPGAARAAWGGTDVLPARPEAETEPVAVEAQDSQGGWTIDRVIEERAIRTLFQPIVHLATKAVVGFEALSRGPEGTDLESPLALLDAAAAAGRLAELDWLCRVLALQAAAASDLPPSLAWFINVEPASLNTPCPDYLLQDFARASANLRVVFEFVERDLDADVTTVLNAADDVRNNAWGVALDDVGAMDSSLALMPLVRPDVVKLDRGLLAEPGGLATTPVVTAVHAYAERRNAVILAEGIETPDEEIIAKSYGAEFGQGYLYGRPGPLPETLPPPFEVVPIRQIVEPVEDMTPFEALSAQIPARHATGSDVSYIDAWFRHTAAAAGHPGLAMANFYDTTWVTEDDLRALKQVISSNALTLITAGDLPDHSGPVLRTRTRPASNPMSREWVLIVLQPHFAAAFAARNKGAWSQDDPHLDFVLTHDRDLVVAAARALLQGIDPGGARWLDGLGDTAERPSDPAPESGRSKPRLLRFRSR